MLTQRQLFLHWFGWSFITAVITTVTLVCLLLLLQCFASRRLLSLTDFLIRLWFLAIRGRGRWPLLVTYFFITPLLGCLADFTALGRWRRSSFILIISVHYVLLTVFCEVTSYALSRKAGNDPVCCWYCFLVYLTIKYCLTRGRMMAWYVRKTICVNFLMSNQDFQQFTDDDD